MGFMRIAVLAAAALGLAACLQPVDMVWVRTDGRVIKSDPVLLHQAEIDRTICGGDTGRAGLTGLNPVTPDGGNRRISERRGELSADVMRGCMAEKGYVYVRADEAEARSAEFAAVAAENARRDAGPPASVRKPPARTTAAR
jgi:hypothetical protein